MRKLTDSIADLWIERTRVTDAPQFRLFCFPDVGGGAGAYRGWARELRPNVEICAIRLPGRERRYAEAPLRRAEQVVAPLAPILRDFLDLPFAMFGHGMGAVLAYEVVRALRTAPAVEPRALFVSAHPAPQSRLRRCDWHALPRDELIAELKALDGTPPEVFENDNLVDLMLPMLRGDLELIETYRSPAAPPRPVRSSRSAAPRIGTSSPKTWPDGLRLPRGRSSPCCLTADTSSSIAAGLTSCRHCAASSAWPALPERTALYRRPDDTPRLNLQAWSPFYACQIEI